jgi:ribonucleotide monophosphatase NagD (HAD superfamily)
MSSEFIWIRQVKRFAFVTNNSRMSRKQHAKKLINLDIEFNEARFLYSFLPFLFVKQQVS